MKPIYFPFTYISKPMAEILHACFGKTVVYQPRKKNIPEEIHRLAERGVLDISISEEAKKKDEEKLSAILKEYDAWANLHQESRGIHLDFFKAMNNKIPFFNDTSASQIKADIKDITDGNPVRKKIDPIFNARIFLSIAQNFDIQNDIIIQDMASFETARMDLIKSLRAEDEVSPGVTGYQDEFTTGNLADSDHMITERIEAWTLLMCCDPMHRTGEMSGLFVTKSRQAIDYLLEKTPEAENVFSIDAIPMPKYPVKKPAKWFRDLMEYFEIVSESSMPLKCDQFAIAFDDLKSKIKISLSFYLVSGVSPLEYFSRFIRFDSSGNEMTKDQVKLKNTIIGHIGFSPDSMRSLKK
ncbi:MAG: hypothetical protein GY797_02435 [Deltaproteobacteria bacterium]|nr:hypothetical protein [Deltaproteobacteria bacterium]